MASGQLRSGEGLLEVQYSFLHLPGGEQLACGHPQFWLPVSALALRKPWGQDTSMGRGPSLAWEGPKAVAILGTWCTEEWWGLAGLRMGTWGSVNGAVPLGTF